jgi:hypothetical protein
MCEPHAGPAQGPPLSKPCVDVVVTLVDLAPAGDTFDLAGFEKAAALAGGSSGVHCWGIAQLCALQRPQLSWALAACCFHPA